MANRSGYHPAQTVTREDDVNYGFNALGAICSALGMTEHDLDAERKQIEMSPRAWLDRKLKALGYTKTSGTSA